MSNVWEVLSAISVNEHTKKKGRFTYLSWTWAWATLKNNYPTATYEFHDNEVHGDSSVTTHCTVNIDDLSHTMWLAVTDNSNKAIPNPSCADIGITKMRCLTKCLAMFGLGHYIYAGESFPVEPDEPVEPVSPVPDYIKLIWDSAIEDEDALSLGALCALLSEEQETYLNSSFPTGKISANKAMVKQLCAESVYDWEMLSNGVVAMIEAEDAIGLLEATSELKKHEKQHLARLISKEQINKLTSLLNSLEAA